MIVSPLANGESQVFILHGDLTCWDPGKPHSGRLAQPCYLLFCSLASPWPLAGMGKGKVKVEVAQSCLTLRDPVDL